MPCLGELGTYGVGNNSGQDSDTVRIFLFYDLAKTRDCREMLVDLQKGKMEVSYRNRIELDIEQITLYL